MGGPQRESLGPYELGPPLASGSSASVHLGVRRGPLGFRRLVAIKRLHEELARDPDAVAMLLEEARLAAQIRHPHVVPALDVVDDRRGLALVAEYVDGLSLAALRNEAWPPPVHVAIAVVHDVCTALAALHAARGHQGESLGIVHRDVSPKNVLVGADGYARLIDLGVAKAHRRGQQTGDGAVKGTLAYLAPEQIDGRAVDARTDVFAVGVLAWELLTGERAFTGSPLAARALSAERLALPSSVRAELPSALDTVVKRAVAPEPSERFPDAASFANALAAIVTRSPVGDVSVWVENSGQRILAERRSMVRALTTDDAPADEGSTATVNPPANSPRARTPRAKAQQRTPWLATALIVAVVAGWLLGRNTTVLPSTAAEAPAPGPKLAAVSSTAATATSAFAIKPPTAESAMPPPSSATAAPNATDPVAPPSHKAKPMLAPAPAPSAPADKCSPPYTIDDRGVRRFKVECL